MITLVELDGYNAVATDTHRLAAASMELEIDRPLLVPRELIMASRTLLSGCCQDPVTLLERRESNVVWVGLRAGDGGEAWARFDVMQSYPNWMRMLCGFVQPVNHRRESTTAWLSAYDIDRGEWERAFGRLEWFIDDSCGGARTQLTINEDNRMGLCSMKLSNSRGTFLTRVPISDGPTLHSAFSSSYMADALRFLKGDTVRLRASQQPDPWLLSSGDRFVAQMPMQLEA